MVCVINSSSIFAKNRQSNFVLVFVLVLESKALYWREYANSIVKNDIYRTVDIFGFGFPWTDLNHLVMLVHNDGIVLNIL